ncbi:MAG: beta-lactamase family protein [Vicinamibacteria bacterium]|nr:beta-lactamase family protein [Vicinamibacteria bacterium]MBP9945168.1 beta-lactamase family protein [Vicinamibacteria bacterium]
MMMRSRSTIAVTLAFLTAFAPLAAASQAARPVRPKAAPPPRPAANRVPPARFADPDRLGKLARAFPEIDKAFLNFAQGGNAPGVAWGVIVDGELVHSGATGARDVPSNVKAMPDSVFRIASMTKNFAGLAIMKLRDQGRLSLDAPVSRYVPELKNLPLPTTDSPEITVRHLLTHSEGFPEDNPWGDRQLAESDATLSRWMRAGFPFSQAPGMGYEYSNTGFAILGQVIARVSGMRARDFIDRELLKPLGMTSTKWDTSAVPGDRIARGYGRVDGQWVAETPLADGSYGIMGGLYSTVPDLAKLVGMYLSAYPARDGDDRGPLKRASLREMQIAHSPYRSTALRPVVNGPLNLSSGGYAFGLASTQTCRFANVVAHSGGLPGYGSQMRWLPEYGVGIVALANGTYAGPGRAVNESLEALARTGALNPRVPQPGPELISTRAAIDELVNRWSDDGLRKVAAMNLLLDRSLDRRRQDFESLREKHGVCRGGSDIEAENALRGRWTLTCERGQVRVNITLAPTLPPTVQSLETSSILPASAGFNRVAGELVRSMNSGEPLNESLVSLSAPKDVAGQIAAARVYGTCVANDLVAGGPDSGTLRLNCDRGRLDLRLTVDSAGLLTGLRIAPASGEVCVP